MKKTNLILSTVLTMILFSAALSFSDQFIVCIDPGHGGPGANKYFNGGDDYGGAGPVLGIAEQWVNFQVALELYEMIQFGTFYNVIMTRTSEGDTSIPTNHTRNLWYRANKANYGDNGNPVDCFISIHHNGLEPVGTKGTEVFWTSVGLTDSGDARYYGFWRPAWHDSLLAMKIHFRLLDWWHYPDLCSSRCDGGSSSIYCCDNDYFVLRNTVMPSALSEASNLNDAVEESLFNDPETGHAEAEAFAIFEGWESHRDNMGIAIVKNGYSGGNAGKVVIADWSCHEGDDTVSSPYVRCWLQGEQYCLKAITPQVINGYQYIFHHWTHLDPWGGQIGDNCYSPDWPITVWAEWNFHRYVAYFTGGPYSAQVVRPNGYEIWRVGEQRTIEWNVSPGVDSTTYVDVFLDRNGGNDGYPELIVDSIPGAYYWGWTWTVTPPYSTHCRIKVVAYDRADNSAEDISNLDFIISASGNNDPVIDSYLHCKYPEEECSDCIQYGEQVTIEILAHDPDGDSIYYEWYCQPFMGGHFQNGQNTITTAENYVVYTAPTKAKADSSVTRWEGEKVQWDVFLKVTVVDVRGGSNDTIGYLGVYDPGYTCICGDVNNDCEIELGDIVYLNNYVFQSGPPPECCWFPPAQ